jgi:hypothetical protein
LVRRTAEYLTKRAAENWIGLLQKIEQKDCRIPDKIKQNIGQVDFRILGTRTAE